jgi:hypothetical protein
MIKRLLVAFTLVLWAAIGSVNAQTICFGSNICFGPSSVVSASLPYNTQQPIISGLPVVGGQLTLNTGTWNNNPSLSCQWNDIAPLTGVRTPISGATDCTGYTVQSSDVGDQLNVTVTGSNSLGSVPSILVSPVGLVPPVEAAVPVNTTLPSFPSSNLTIGAIITCNQGSWSNDPNLFNFSWTDDGVLIPTNGSQHYAIQGSDVGHSLACNVIAQNSAGQSIPAKFSAAVPSNANAPINTALPTIKGNAVVGSTLTASGATFTGGLVAPRYQWQDCTAPTGGTCTPITSANSDIANGTIGSLPNYQPQSSDAGFYIGLTANSINNLSNGQVGSTTVSATTAVGPVAAVPVTVLNSPPATTPPAIPTLTVAPTIAGSIGNQFYVGSDIVATTGTWGGGVPSDFEFTWYRNGTPITGAVNQSYTLQAADQGQTINVGVIAQNAGGNSLQALSASISPTAFPIAGGTNCAGYGSSTIFDGCALAPAPNPYNIQHSNFFSGYAIRSGQVYPSTNGCKGMANCHPTWAVSGVDYPTGVSNVGTGFAKPETSTDPTSKTANFTDGKCSQGGNGLAFISCTAGTDGAINIGPLDFSWQGNDQSGPIFITNPGTGYTAPKVVFSGGGCVTVPTATATVGKTVNGVLTEAGEITAINYQVIGKGCTSAPQLTITDPTGSGATATASGPSGLGLSISGGTGPCVIHDSYFVFDLNVTHQSSGDAAYTFSGCSSLTLINDVFRVRDPVTGQIDTLFNGVPSGFVVWIATGNPASSAANLNRPTILENVAMINCPSRCVAAGVLMSHHNYFEGPNMMSAGAAHGDGLITSFYNGPAFGPGVPCNCSGLNLWQEKLDTWLLPSNGASANTCISCSVINVPGGSVSGTTNGDGILHVTNINPSGGSFMGPGSIIVPGAGTKNFAPISGSALVTQCQDASGNVGCSETFDQSCSTTTPCLVQLNTPWPACPNAQQTAPCTWTYTFAATVKVGDYENNVWVANATYANGAAGSGFCVGWPCTSAANAWGLFYATYLSTTVINNYADLTAISATKDSGSLTGATEQGPTPQWTMGYPAYTYRSPLYPASSYNGINWFSAGGAPTQNDGGNVSLTNGACLSAFQGTLSGSGVVANPTECNNLTTPPLP